MPASDLIHLQCFACASRWVEPLPHGVFVPGIILRLHSLRCRCGAGADQIFTDLRPRTSAEAGGGVPGDASNKGQIAKIENEVEAHHQREYEVACMLSSAKHPQWHELTEAQRERVRNENRQYVTRLIHGSCPEDPISPTKKGTIEHG